MYLGSVPNSQMASNFNLFPLRVLIKAQVNPLEIWALKGGGEITLFQGQVKKF